MRLEGAAALITGGSTGIGKATAQLLIEHGASVAITGRHADRLERTAEEIGATPIQADVSNEDDVRRTYQEFFKHFKRLDVLVNNAAIGNTMALDNLTAEAFRTVLNVNVVGAAMMAKYAAVYFRKQNSGNIINIGSTYGVKGTEMVTVYAASKFALRGMTECWRAELRRHNVRVMLINPSEVTTSFLLNGGEENPEQPKKLRPVDIAHAVKAVLEMDDRGFVTDLTVYATNPWHTFEPRLTARE